MNLAKRVTLLCLLAGCGASKPPETLDLPPPTNVEDFPSAPIELSIHVPGRGFFEVGEMRGRAGLIFVFSTFDTASQAMLTPLSLISEAHPECFFVGVAYQPDARQLVEVWAQALEPPFPVGWDPQDVLASARSPVGRIGGVPMVITVDPQGRVVEKVEGVLQPKELDEMLVRAKSRGR